MPEQEVKNSLKKTEKPKIKETPLVKQYNSIKVKHPNRLLLFRMGDFFELFGKDAETAAPVLDIALTKRNKKDENSDYMCGFPHHAMEAHVNKLLKSGFSVAICDQVEDPKEAKGLVKREVVMMLSPGVVFNPDSLDAETSHFVFAFNESQACWYEPSTGRAYYKGVASREDLSFLLRQIKPAEVLYIDDLDKEGLLYFENRFTKYEGQSGLSPKEMLLDFVKKMQGSEALFSFLGWTEFSDKNRVNLSKNFFNHLEVFESNEKESSAKSLVDSIKRTKTPGGTRLLKEWLMAPTRSKQVLEERLLSIEKWTKDFEYLKFFRDGLSNVGDLERRISRAGHSLGNPTDLLRLKRALQSVIYSYSREESEWLSSAKGLADLIEGSIEEDFHAQWASKGGYIKKGYNAKMDKLISSATGSREEVAALEEREKIKTKIPSLKVRYNNVFGFYIEVTKVHSSKVPSYYMRKQTLTNAERYTTEELSKIEEKVLSAQTKRISLEKELFNDIKNKIKSLVKELKMISEKVSRDDIYSAWAFLSIEKGYTKPSFVNEMRLNLTGSFHPVVSDDLKTFVSNDIILDEKDCLLITGPNMAGKSTVMRQVVISSYLALCGFYVPAKSAQIPFYDGLYTRIGASDLLSRGLSTFMVEMKETAEILDEASSKSLLILDEIGRGTSSKDGMALAKSILEFIVTKKGAHTFFATHYHELKELEFHGVRNVHMGYSNEGASIKFLYKLLKGASEKSYGIEVAKLAGLPESVISSALSINVSSETEEAVSTQQVKLDEKLNIAQDVENDFGQMNFLSAISDDSGIRISEDENKVLEEIKTLKTNQMTPLEALNIISQWQDNFL